ncbi:hypothetical protein ABZS76_32810 [Streptomyces sp. NPDC005562]|uniref:hypothetical protein n=1 Tax=Streptomyces sp. NPDC005562 TaxID=3154890 RepID=UPI0033B78F17
MTQPKLTMDDVFALVPEQLTTMTPPQIDAHNAVLYDEYQRLDGKRARAWDSLQRALGEQKVQQGRRRVWPLARNEAEEKARALVAAPPTEVPAELKRHEFLLTVEKYMTRIETALAELDAIGDETMKLNQGPHKVLVGEWERRGGWQRFFEVTSSNDGHIHKTNTRYGCPSFRDSTTFGGHPELSGFTQADAVKALGPTLCSHCFPGAPTEWRQNPEDVKALAEAGKWCDGGGAMAKMDARTARRASRYVTCHVCGKRGVNVTSAGRLRKHEPEPGTEKPVKDSAPAAGPVEVEVTLYNRADATVYALVRSTLPPGGSVVGLLADAVATVIEQAKTMPATPAPAPGDLIAVAALNGRTHAADGTGREYEVSVQLAPKQTG